MGQEFQRGPPSGSAVWGTTAGTVVSGEQKSKDDGERSLAQANRKSLHP